MKLKISFFCLHVEPGKNKKRLLKAYFSFHSIACSLAQTFLRITRLYKIEQRLLTSCSVIRLTVKQTPIWTADKRAFFPVPRLLRTNNKRTTKR